MSPRRNTLGLSPSWSAQSLLSNIALIKGLRRSSLQDLYVTRDQSLIKFYLYHLKQGTVTA